MPITASKPSSSRLIAACTIAAVHAGAIYGLMHLRARTPASVVQSPVVVSLIAESSARPEWQPPKVTPVLPAVDTQAPIAPLIEIPVAAPESSHAINVPVFAAMPQAPSQQPTESAKLVAAVEYLRLPDPRYPPQSRKLREQGLVLLRVVIDERGAACEVAIQSSSGYERLDRAALEAIARAEFRPYVEDGVARRALVLIPIEFSLSRRPAQVAASGA